MHFQAILHNISYISPIIPNSLAASQIPLNNHADRVRGCKLDIELLQVDYLASLFIKLFL